MRLIFTILLIGLLKADAQLIINASSPYRPLGVNSIFDDFTGAAAGYSLRKLRTAYTGAAIRVRKDTTGQPEQDINFVGNELDTAALKSFLNARSGFVTTWYDQSGNARNATQTIQANQPRIANLGVLEKDNNKVCLSFDGTNDLLRLDDLSSTVTGEDKPFTTIGVLSKTNTTTVGTLLAFGNTSLTNPILGTFFSNTGNDYRFFIRDNAATFRSFNDGNYLANIQYLIFQFTIGLSIEYYSNNILQVTNTYNLGTLTLNTAAIGALVRSTIGDYFGGKMQEVIFYSSDKSSDRIGIQNNINTYYSIY